MSPPPILQFIQTSAIYRPMESELVAMELSGVEFYCFSLNADFVFDYFRKPQSIATFLDAQVLGNLTAAQTKSEWAYLLGFFELLLAANLVKVVSPPALPHSTERGNLAYSRPIFLRTVERSLSEMAALWNISGPNTSESGI